MVIEKRWVAAVVLLSGVLVGVSPGGYTADMNALRPSAQWLAKERLKGTLFHHTVIKTPDPLQVSPADEKATPTESPVVLRGRHHLIILVAPGETIQVRLRTVRPRPPFARTSYAVFDPAGVELENGLVAEGEEKTVAVVAQRSGPHVVVLNSGPASSTVTQVVVQNAHWGIDMQSRPPYRSGPMHYHFLRDLKLGGFNLAMVDVEYMPQEFLSDEGLQKWVEMIRGWMEAARRYQLRTLIAIDLGGTKAEVESWGDAPKGLYIKHEEKLPLAPCPLQKVYWERILLRRAREVAKISLNNPYVVGLGIDPEMYQCWIYGHYMLSGTCFCDRCLGGFLRQGGLSDVVLKEKAEGKARHEWLVQQKLMPRYEAYLEQQMAQLAAWCRDEVHRINPEFLWCVYVLEIGNWFCRGLARGLSQPDLPVINFCEHTYYSVGYDREWLDKTIQKAKDWGANMLQGSALWDMHFPPVRPGYLAAHAYNLAVRAEGWWYWPGDRLYDDWNVTHTYQGQPAYVEDYWNAAVTANHEIDLTMTQPGRTSPLDNAERVPWRGKYSGEKGWAEDSGVKSYKETPCPLRLGAPAKVYFAMPKRAKAVEVFALARGAGNGADVCLHDPAGVEKGRVKGELDAGETISVESSAEGIWALEVNECPGIPFNDVGIALKPTSMVCASKSNLLVTPTKAPGLVGYWPLDEGQGEKVADVSQQVAYHGTLSGGTWTAGVRGGALAFDGKSGGVRIPAGEALHNLTQFTLSAWVRLDALPEKGNGATLVNKGPEAPVQHFWWWIGYPPDHRLILEVGNEKHRWGQSLGSKALQWKVGQWYHVAVVFKSEGGKSTATHYRDGQHVGTTTLDEPFDSGEYDMQLGTYGSLHWLNGALDEVKVWDRALTAEEIRREAALPNSR